MLIIESVRPESAAARAGLCPGDRIVTLNGEPVRDLLDFHFHIDDEPRVKLEVLRGVLTERREVRRNGEPDLGLTFAPLKTRLCGNQCVFCFVDQMPAGMRRTLYVKDEDYRLSFLHGNFVTLTNMKEWELRRIVDQRLSPLYISVHSTTAETRRRLMRPRVDRDILPILRFLGENGITMHTQIVLCPGYNDGADLDRTITDLAAFHPDVASLAIVPLGMTEHREGLTELDPVTPALARRVLDQVVAYQREFRRRLGSTFVHLADEWYRLLGREVPPASHYDGFPQIENGIGMTRDFLGRLSRTRRLFRPEILRGLDPSRRARVTLVTGELFRPILEAAVSRKLERTAEPVELSVVGVANRFFGSGVTVAGLLVGKDIAEALESTRADLVLIPPATLNTDGLFLDDMSLAELERRVGAPVRAGFRDQAF